MTHRLWLEQYDPGVATTIDIPTDETIYSVFKKTAHKYPHHRFFMYCGKTTTYAEAYDDVNRCAGMFHEMGMGVGDRIALHMPNTPQWIIAYLAALKIGGIIVPLNPLTKKESLAELLIKTGTRVIITLTKFLSDVQSIRREARLERVIVAHIKDEMGWATKMLFSFFYERKLGHALRDIPLDIDRFSMFRDNGYWYTPDDSLSGNVAVLPCTGGVTGEPKIVQLTHYNLLANALQSVNCMVGFRYGEEVVAGFLPLFHIYGLTNVLNAAIITGSSIALSPDPRDVRRVISSIKKTKVTIFPGVPDLFRKILEHPASKQGLVLKTIKICVSGAAPLDTELKDRFERATHSHIIEGFGLSEASPTTHCNPILHTDPCSKGSIGVPIVNTDAAIMDIESGRILPPGNEYVGEIVVAGPQVMLGYWEDSEATARVRSGDWLRTGDIGYMDERGFFFIVGRRKEVILVGGSGVKVYPNQIESVLSSHPDVLECAVVRGYDEQKREYPRALVIPRAYVTDPHTLRESLVTYCEQKLTSHAVPRVIDFVDHIPRTILGKPLRREIEQQQAQTPSM